MTIDTTHLIISFVSLIIGVPIGWFTRGLVDRVDKNKDLKNFVIFVVTMIFVASVIMEMINPAYHMNPMMFGLMGTIVGFFVNFKGIIKPTGEVQNEKDNKSA